MKQEGLDKYYQAFWITKILRFFFRLYCRLVFTIYSPLKSVKGLENIPSNTPLILCSNHNSHMDTAILGIIACKSYNFLGALAAKDYWFDNPFFNFIASCMFQLIPIQRHNNSSSKKKESLTMDDTLYIAKKFLNNNNSRLVIYPEGTRSTTGEMRVLKDGASFFSMNLNLPILPIYLTGISKIWGKGKFLMRPYSFSAHIGNPIFPSQTEDIMTDKKRAKKITLLLSDELKRISHD